MHSVPRERRLDPVTLEILQHADAVARDLAVVYCVVGAMARDILLTGVFGLSAGRATRDVDLAVAMQGWREFGASMTRKAVLTTSCRLAAPTIASLNPVYRERLLTRSQSTG